MLLADYTAEAEGELNAKAGDVVQLVSRETTGRHACISLAIPLYLLVV